MPTSPWPADSILRRAAGGTLWACLADGSFRTLRIASNLVLARLLSPDDIGLVSFALIAILALSQVQDLGMPEALVYGRREIRPVAGTALTINVGAALVLFVVTVLGAPALAEFGGRVELGPILWIMAIGLIIDALGSVPQAGLIRDLAFRRKFLPDVLPTLASGLTAIGLALAGMGAWSLVWGYLAMTLVSTATLWLVSPIRPRPAFDRAVAGQLLAYGRHVTFHSLVTFLGSNVDFVIVGYFLGAHELGLYAVAFLMATVPLMAIGDAAASTAFPTYARLRHDPAALWRVVRDTAVVVAAVSGAVASAVFICAPAFAPLLVGRQWDPSLEPLKFLLVYAVLRTPDSVLTPLFRAIGRPDLTWKLRGIRLLVAIPAIGFGVQFGLVGVALAQLAVTIVSIILQTAVAARITRRPLPTLWLVAGPTVLATASLAAIVVIVRLSPGLGPWADGPIGSLALLTVGLAGYVSVLIALDRRLLVLAGLGVDLVRARLSAL